MHLLNVKTNIQYMYMYDDEDSNLQTDLSRNIGYNPILLMYDTD